MALIALCSAVFATGSQVFSIGAIENRVETVLSQEFAGVAVDVQGMRMRLDLRRRDLHIHADNIQFAGHADAPDTIVSDVGARFSLPELLHGRVNPRGLSWGGLRFGVVADAEGNLVMGLNSSKALSGEQTGTLPAFLGRAYASAPALGIPTDDDGGVQAWTADRFAAYSQQKWVAEFFDAAPSVSNLMLNNAALSYRDLKSGLGVETRDAELSLARQADGSTLLTIDGELAIGRMMSADHPQPAEDENWSWQQMPVAATVRLDEAQQVQTVRVSLPELEPEKLQWLAPDNAFWTSAKGVLDTQASVHLDPQGHIERFSGYVDGLLSREFHFSGKPADDNQGWRLDFLTSGLTPAQDPYLTQHFDVLSAADAPFSGTTTLFLDPFGATKIYQISASQDGPGQLWLPTVWTEAKSVRNVDLSLWGDATTWDMTTNGTQLNVGDAWIDFDLVADGQETARGAQVRMDIAAEAEMSVAQVRALWPNVDNSNDPARDWFDENVIRMVFVDPALSLQLSGAPGQAIDNIDSLKLGFDYRNAQVQVTPAMGVASIVEGRFTARNQMINVNGSHGSLGPLQGRDLDLEIDFSAPNSGLLRLDVDLQGDVVPAFEWMAIADIGLDDITSILPVAQMSGRSSGRFSTTLPLSDDTQLTERLFSYRYEGQINNFAVLDFVSGQSLRGTGARIVTNNKGTDIAAAVSVGSSALGHSTTADLVLNVTHATGDVGVQGEFQSTVRSLTPFIGGLSDFGEGSVAGQFQYSAAGQKSQATLDVLTDLQNVEIDLPFVFYRKPSGVPTNASVRVALKNNEPIGIDSFRVVSNDAQATGRVEFSPESDGATQIWMNDVRLQGSTITNLNMLVAEKQIDVVLRGGAINAIPAVQTLFASDADRQTAGQQRREKGFGLEPDAVIVVRAEDIDRLFLPKNKTMRNVSASLLLQNNGVEHMRFRAQPPAIHNNRAADAGYLTASIEPVTGGYTFTLTTDDAGAAMHATNVNENVRLGSLQIQAYSPLAFPHGAWRGSLNGENIFLYNAPIFGRLFQVASLTGIGELLSGTGLGFTRVNADFNYAPGNIHIDNWQMLGPSIGMTGQGGIYFDAQQVNLRGTVTPLGVLNEITQQLPLFGTLLNGLDGGGLFSATYAIQGSFEDPNMYVNPWTSLTPGAFRDLYKALTGSF